jgi:hypothetical protein
MTTAEKLIAAAPKLLALLIESQESIGGDWRDRRDAVIAELAETQRSSHANGSDETEPPAAA